MRLTLARTVAPPYLDAREVYYCGCGSVVLLIVSLTAGNSNDGDGDREGMLFNRGNVSH
jgi:hypothetical protein